MASWNVSHSVDVGSSSHRDSCQTHQCFQLLEVEPLLRWSACLQMDQGLLDCEGS